MPGVCGAPPATGLAVAAGAAVGELEVELGCGAGEVVVGCGAGLVVVGVGLGRADFDGVGLADGDWLGAWE